MLSKNETLESYFRLVIAMEKVRECVMPSDPDRATLIYKQLEQRRRDLHNQVLLEIGMTRGEESDIMLANLLEEFRSSAP